MRPGIDRISGIRAKDTRSGTATALLLTAIGNVLLSLLGLPFAVALPPGDPGGICRGACRGALAHAVTRVAVAVTLAPSLNVKCKRKKKKIIYPITLASEALSDKKSNR